MAAEQPKRGILKTSSSFDHDGQHDAKKQAKWDEMNILATYHPPGKEYGHMKIDEPLTPFNREAGAISGDEAECELDPMSLAARLENQSDPRVLQDEEGESSEEDVNETEEERAKRKKFEQRRKLHYNEFYAVKLARQLMAEDPDEDEEEGTSSEKKEENSTAQ